MEPDVLSEKPFEDLDLIRRVSLLLTEMKTKEDPRLGEVMDVYERSLAIYSTINAPAVFAASRAVQDYVGCNHPALYGKLISYECEL